MVSSAMVALAILITGMISFYILMQDQWVRGLAPENRETLESLIANDVIDPDALTTLVSVFSFSWTEDYAAFEVYALLSFAVLAIISSAYFGISTAKRLARPIETVANAARTVSEGAYETEVELSHGRSSEAHDLLTSFNAMTASLKRAELEAKGSAAAIAHELRTPLTILRGRLQGLSDGAFEPSNKLITALIGQVDTLSAIVNDLATLTHLTESNGTFERDAVDLADIAHAVVTSLAPDLLAAGMVIEKELNTASTRASPDRIRQALNALIVNAIRYASEGQYICVATGQSENGVFLSVSDKGPGIPEEYQNRVFERWWRADNSRSRALGGSGLGLSVVKAIAEGHGGEATVAHGSGGRGAVFKITLP
jgi:two-component system sensor histidine kinase AdeS